MAWSSFFWRLEFVFMMLRCVHDVTLVKLLYFIHCSLTLPASCYFALGSPNHVFQFNFGLMVPLRRFMLSVHATLLRFICLMPICFFSSASRHAVWSCKKLVFMMLRRFTFSWHRLPGLTFPMSCCATPFQPNHILQLYPGRVMLTCNLFTASFGIAWFFVIFVIFHIRLI